MAATTSRTRARPSAGKRCTSFVDAGLVVLNPDDPQRAVNSPRTCYEVAPRALDLLRLVGTNEWSGALRSYLKELPGLREQYARARELEQLPVTLPEGGAVTLTPGGQNLLIKAMVEEFCSRFTPGGHVLYVGDTGKADPIFAEDELEKLGVSLDKHGKLPDLIVYLPGAIGSCSWRRRRATGRSTRSGTANCARASAARSPTLSTCLASPLAARCAGTWRTSHGRRRCGAPMLRIT